MQKNFLFPHKFKNLNFNTGKYFPVRKKLSLNPSPDLVKGSLSQCTPRTPLCCVIRAPKLCHLSMMSSSNPPETSSSWKRRTRSVFITFPQVAGVNAQDLLSHFVTAMEPTRGMSASETRSDHHAHLHLALGFASPKTVSTPLIRSIIRDIYPDYQHCNCSAPIKNWPKTITYLMSHGDYACHNIDPDQDAQPKKKRKTHDDIVLRMQAGESPLDLLQDYPGAVGFHWSKLNSLYTALATPPSTKPFVYLFTGTTGTGKTRLAMAFYNSYRPPLGKGGWFDGYCAHRTLVLDDFRGGLPLDFLLQLLDWYPVQLPVKGGHTPLHATRVVITSNTMPDDWYPREDLSPLWRRIDVHIDNEPELAALTECKNCLDDIINMI